MKLFGNANIFHCLLLAVIAWICALSVPPMQSPDENQHIARAYLFAHGEFLLQTPPDLMSGGYIDKGLHQFITDGMKISGHPDLKMSKEDVQAMTSLRWEGANSRTFLQIPGTGYYFPAIYTPHAIGILIGEQLNLSIYDSYQITRFITIFSSLAFILWAFRLIAANPAIMGLLFLPMSLFQLLSPTLDGLTTGMSLVIVGLFLSFFNGPRKEKDFYILACLIFLIATTRIHLLSFILFLFVISWKERNVRFATTSIFVSFSSISWIYFSIRHTVDNRVPRELSSMEILIHYMVNPGEFLSVLYRTLTSSDRMVFYWHSFIGKLGWLDAPLENIFYIILPILLIFLFFSSLFGNNNKPSAPSARIYILLAASLSMVAIFAALLISWTPFPATVINGIQGRYFTVPLILIFFAFQGIFNNHNKNIEYTKHGVLALFTVCSVSALFIAIFTRFHSIQ